MYLNRVTIQDVAKVARVHKSTVSRVLNGSSNISKKTREKVEAAIQSLGYSPNSLAQSLAFGKSNTIGLVVSAQQIGNVVLNPFFPTLLKGITTSAEWEGYNILLITAAGTDIESYDRVIKKSTVDGFIIVGAAYNDALYSILEERNVPYVFIGKYADNKDSSFVGIDNVEGGYIATKYLLNLGHKDICLMVGHVKGKLLPHNLDRIKGFKKALDEAGIAFKEKMILKTPTDMDNSYHFISNLVNYEKPSALILSNEVTAIACLNALLDKDISIPDEISLIAFGDEDFYRNIRPRLTTIAQNFEWLAKAAVEMLLEKINGVIENPKAIIRKPELVVRESTEKIK